MRVLTVCREAPLNLTIHKHSIAEFIFEQNKALEYFGVDYDYYLIKKGGYKGYFKEVNNFHFFLKEKKYNYDIIHAHGGHIGSLVNTQRKIPVVTTYHGSDINNPISRLTSLISLLFSNSNIFVSTKLFKKVKKFAGGTVIPCGVDFNIFKPLDKVECRKNLGLNENKKIVLFAGRKERREKNYKLAKEAAYIANVDNLVELKDFTREEVNLLLNASELLLLTSISEGSPQVIKEAMSCNCPIVTTDVGDIRQIISDTEGCYITSFDPSDVAEKIKLALQFHKRTIGREVIKYLDNQIIAKKILNIYQTVISK
jgi:teichuronic acid biosynthesis glycosyltransferase TuaC